MKRPRPALFRHRRLSPSDFVELMKLGGLTIEDVCYLTGRRREQIERFIAGNENQGFNPTMADAMVLELAVLDEANVDDMLDIADMYAIDLLKEGSNGNR